MGGSIRTIIIKDDVVHKLDGYTNGLPNFVTTDKFIEGNDSHINNYVKYFDEEIGDGKFSPDGYGIVIFNFDKKHILSLQGYTSFYTIGSTSIEIYISDMVSHSGVDEDDVPPNTTRRLWDKNYIRIFNYHSQDEIYDAESYDASWEIIKEKSRTRNTPSAYKMLWEENGWTYIDYPEDGSGIKPFLLFLLENNYHLTPEDITNWYKFNEWDCGFEDKEFESEAEYDVFIEGELKFFNNFLRKKKIKRLSEKT